MTGYEADLQKERDAKDQFMARHPESPFIIGEVGAFEGLHYFPIDPSYRVEARLERLPTPQEATLRTNRDEELTCRYIGDLKFELDHQEYSLRVFHAGEQVGPSVFIPFRDATCGSESYGPGRYLILQLTEDDRYTLDFNMAFNPYCAYTDRFECGFPPAENDLPVPIRAGEMVWQEEDMDAVVVGPEPVDPVPRARRSAPAKTDAAPAPAARPASKRSGDAAPAAASSRSPASGGAKPARASKKGSR
jgi:uncharacterized protein (DUF1684 family)